MMILKLFLLRLLIMDFRLGKVLVLMVNGWL